MSFVLNSQTSWLRSRAAASAYWNDRSLRERKQWLVIGSIVILALIYLVFIDPALFGRAQLRKSLPELRQKAADMQQLARDAALLSATVLPLPPALSKEGIDSSLAARGLKAQSVIVTDDVLRLQLNTVSFATLVDWLGETQKSLRLSMVDATVVAQPGSDVVSATLTLRQQKNESRRE